MCFDNGLSPIKSMNIADQNMQKILEENKQELNAFILDIDPEVEKHTKVKAFICFALARHYALETVEKERSEG